MANQKTLNYLISAILFVTIINYSNDKNYLVTYTGNNYREKVSSPPISNPLMDNSQNKAFIINIENINSLNKYLVPITTRSLKDDCSEIEAIKQGYRQDFKNKAFKTLGLDSNGEWNWSDIEQQYAFLMGDDTVTPPNPVMNVNSVKDIREYTQAYSRLRELFRKELPKTGYQKFFSK